MQLLISVQGPYLSQLLHILFDLLIEVGGRSQLAGPLLQLSGVEAPVLVVGHRYGAGLQDRFELRLSGAVFVSQLLIFPLQALNFILRRAVWHATPSVNERERRRLSCASVTPSVEHSSSKAKVTRSSTREHFTKTWLPTTTF